jgi:hypothetical protein
MLAAVVAEVLDPDQRGLGAPELAPAPRLGHQVSVPEDAPEEIVRGEEDQVPTAVSVAGDHVVLARGHYGGLVTNESWGRNHSQPRGKDPAYG